MEVVGAIAPTGRASCEEGFLPMLPSTHSNCGPASAVRGFREGPAKGKQMRRRPLDSVRPPALLVIACSLLLAATAACSRGDEGPPGPGGPDGPQGPPGVPGEPLPDSLGPGGELPGFVITILDVSGGTGPGGNLRAGDRPSVTFKLSTRDGKAIPLAQVTNASALVSGPTGSYQRVLNAESNLQQKAVRNADGSLTYTFEAPIPAVYGPPYNDSPSFGRESGELQGDPLQSGTYTLGMEAYATYSIRDVSVRDSGNATRDFLMGDAMQLEAHPEVVKQDACNQCHTRLQAHGAIRNSLGHCLLCHTSGSRIEMSRPSAGALPASRSTLES
jgi:hypothetical protein